MERLKKYLAELPNNADSVTLNSYLTEIRNLKKAIVVDLVW